MDTHRSRYFNFTCHLLVVRKYWEDGRFSVVSTEMTAWCRPSFRPGDSGLTCDLICKPWKNVCAQQTPCGSLRGWTVHSCWQRTAHLRCKCITFVMLNFVGLCLLFWLILFSYFGPFFGFSISLLSFSMKCRIFLLPLTTVLTHFNCDSVSSVNKIWSHIYWLEYFCGLGDHKVLFIDVYPTWSFFLTFLLHLAASYFIVYMLCICQCFRGIKDIPSHLLIVIKLPESNNMSHIKY